jgi:serine/threonine protein phosphatase 1
MRHLAIGDVHGCLRSLAALIDLVGPQADDVLVMVGDFVDRGPSSRGVLDLLIGLEGLVKLVALRGNHEDVMLRARHSRDSLKSWLEMGGDWALRSYGGRAATLADVPEEHWRFLERTRPFFETETHFFVHAGVDPTLPLAEQPEHLLYWRFFDDPKPHRCGKVMVCGHTTQRSGVPLDRGHAVCIDTGAEYGGGWLTCLDVASGEYWQANERGQTRQGRLGRRAWPTPALL